MLSGRRRINQAFNAEDVWIVGQNNVAAKLFINGLFLLFTAIYRILFFLMNLTVFVNIIAIFYINQSFHFYSLDLALLCRAETAEGRVIRAGLWTLRKVVGARFQGWLY